MLSRGRQPSSSWISRAAGAVTPEEALSLGLSPGAAVYRFRRILCRRSADGARTVDHPQLSPAVGRRGRGPLYAALDLAGNRPVRALQRLRAIPFGAAHARFGTTAFLPTLISEEPARIALALDAADAAIAAGVPGVVGVHIEGPMLNAARKSIHDPGKFRPLDPQLLALLVRPRAGRVMVTLAPEKVAPADLAALVAAGVIVSAGHSEADYDTMIAAFDAGLSGITHLFNAMPPMHQCAPGLVGAALADRRPWCGLIVDKVHVASAVLRIAMKARPFDRMMLVTDAMPSVGGDGGFLLQGRRIDVANGICTFADGTLAGSDLDMATALANCVADLGIAPQDAAAMAATHPAAFLGLSAERGSLAPGCRADWVVLDAGFAPVETRIARESVAA